MMKPIIAYATFKNGKIVDCEDGYHTCGLTFTKAGSREALRECHVVGHDRLRPAPNPEEFALHRVEIHVKERFK